MDADEALQALGSGVWHRLHPLSPIVRTGRGLAGLLIVLIPALLVRSGGDEAGRLWSDGVLLGVLAAAAVVAWLVTRWQIQDGVLRIETGLIRRSSRRFPLMQIQAIDIVRPGLARALGLAELRLRMGGSTGGSARLAYLAARHAEQVREQLLAIAKSSSVSGSSVAKASAIGQTSAPDAPPAVDAALAPSGREGALVAEADGPSAERLLVSTPLGTLIASILLSGTGIVAEAVVVVLILLAVLAPAAEGAVLGSSAAVILGVATALWRRFNGDYRMTVVEAPDGIRLRAGLVETVAETIPRGRVQAMRLVEPVLWRPFGWCRMQLDVAGRQRAEGENQGTSRALRAVLPVGTRAQAQLLLDHILPGAPTERLKAPRRARVKAPFRYHFVSWGASESMAVTTSGRVTRVTDWVPLAKVQSLRWVQGPLQRRLRLASIHLDTAGRNVHAEVRDRDAEEMRRVLADLVDRCRSAREAERLRRSASS